MTRRRYELTDHEWSIISPLLPNKPRGIPRVDDRRVLNGILWRFRTGFPWAEVPERYGLSTTCYNRFVRWRKTGVWDRLLEAVSKACDGDIVMINSNRSTRAASKCIRSSPAGYSTTCSRRRSRSTGWNRRPSPIIQRKMTADVVACSSFLSRL